MIVHGPSFFWNKTFCGHKSPLKVQNLPNKDSNDLKVAHIKLKIHNLIHAFYYVSTQFLVSMNVEHGLGWGEGNSFLFLFFFFEKQCVNSFFFIRKFFFFIGNSFFLLGNSFFFDIPLKTKFFFFSFFLLGNSFFYQEILFFSEY